MRKMHELKIDGEYVCDLCVGWKGMMCTIYVERAVGLENAGFMYQIYNDKSANLPIEELVTWGIQHCIDSLAEFIKRETL